MRRYTAFFDSRNEFQISFQVVTILTHVRNAMLGSPTSIPPKLLLVEMMLTEASSRFTRTTSLQLLSLNGGVTRTEGESGCLHCVTFYLNIFFEQSNSESLSSKQDLLSRRLLK